MFRVRAQSPIEWAEACSNAFVPLQVRATAPRFTATLDRVELGTAVSVTRVACDGSDVFRSARVIAQHPRDDLLVSIHRSGHGSVIQHGREARLDNGRAALYDTSAPYTLKFPGRVSQVVLQVPRRLITKTGNAFRDLTATPLPASASMNALQNLLGAVEPETSSIPSPLERELLGEAITTLLQAVLIPAGRPAAPRIDAQTLARAMRCYIDDNLTDSALTVDHLARVHHVSVRFVHKIFAEHLDDSPGTYLRRQRLSHAYARLCGGDTVLGAGLRSGFTDPDTFTRAFKRHYGFLPSALK